MPFTFACPVCDAKLKATETLVGKTIKCPRCSKPVVVQEPSPTTAGATPWLELPPSSSIQTPSACAEFEDEELPEAEDVVDYAELDEVTAVDDEDADADYEAERRPQKSLARRPRGGVTPDEQSTAMMIYLLALFTGFIGPLILWTMKREESRFIDFHGKEVVNFSITMAIVHFCMFVVGVPFVILTLFLGAFIVVPLIMAVGVYALVMVVLGAVKANQGEWCEFPISIRLIK